MGDNNADDIQKDDVENGDEEDTDTADEADEKDTSEDADDESADDSDDDDEGKSDEDEPDDADDDAGSSKKKDEGKQEDEDDEEDEPPTRKPKTPSEWVEFRQKKKAEKDAAKKGSAKKGGDADEGDEDEDGLAPEDAAAIDKHLAKRLAPIMQKEEQKEVETQIANFISENPDFKPYAAKVAKWSTHEAYKNVPIDRIFYAAAGKDLMKIGARRGKQADQEAKKGRTGGSGGEGDGAQKSWKDTPLEDVGKEIERVKLGKR